jgi:hypothetical protein
MLAYWDRDCEWMGDGLQLAICPSFTGPTGLAALDVSGRSNQGTLTNMDRNTAWQTSGGKIALEFNGLNATDTRNFVSLGSPRGLDKIQVNLSVFLWARPTSGTGTRTLWAAYRGTTNSELYSLLRLEGTTLKYYTSTSAGAFQSVGSLIVTNNVWSFLGFTVSGSLSAPVATITINQAFQSFNLSAVSSTPADGIDFRIGAPQTFGEAFQGQIDDVRGLNRSLTEPEIRQLYEQGRGGGMLYQPPRKRSYFAQVTTLKNYWFRNQQRMIGGGIR